MAEIVQKQTENMSNEIEDLREMQLFSEDMLKRISIARKHMNEKIHMNCSSCVDDYKNYIQHEMYILEKIRKCRDKSKNLVKKSLVEFNIIKRIRWLHEIGLQRFSSDYSLHFSFFNFCKDNKLTTASQTVTNMLKQFAYQPEVWKLAADWYFDNNYVTKAAEMYEKGVNYNPKSTLLYTSAIKLELILITSMETSAGKKAIEEKSCKIINTYVELVLKEIKSVEFIVTVLELLEKHKCTHQIQKNILEFLYKNHRHEEIFWHILAKRELNGIHFETHEYNFQLPSRITEPLLKSCLLKYRQGLNFINPNKKRKLWAYCFETLVELKEKNTFREVSECLKVLLQEAHDEKVLEEQYYSIWVSIVSDEAASQILREATKRYPQSEELWKQRLKYAITANIMTEVRVVFELGIKAMQEKALSLWLMMLRFHLLLSDDEEMIKLFDQGIEQCPEISNVLKPRYIQWLDLHKGIQSAREKYRAIAELEPYCKELHLTMSRLESSQICIAQSIDKDCWTKDASQMNACKDNWRNVHELACKQFQEDADVWINHLKFLFVMIPENFYERIDVLRSNAKDSLSEVAWLKFNEVCEEVTTGLLPKEST